MIDSHCHLDLAQFDEDRDAVIQRAAQAGVNRVINPSTDLPSSKRAVAQADRYEGIFAAVGVHPYDALQVTDDSLAQMAKFAEHAKVVAIGEIGLDFYRDRAPKSAQFTAFERQLQLAQSLGLPVIIHQRDAAVDTMAILRTWVAGGSATGAVLHAFSGDVAMAEEAVSLGFYLGIGGPLTFKNARFLPEVVTHVPPENLLVETDAPFLSPHPFRGKRNEPARVVLVVHKLAELLATDGESLAQRLTENTEKLFAKIKTANHNN